MQYIKYIFFALISISNLCIAWEAPENSKVLEYVDSNLPHYGVLKNSGGFIYVDVDDEYIHHLVSFIQDAGFEEPPYFGREGLVGAHISVIYHDEMTKFMIDEIQECGQVISFTPKSCDVVHPPKWSEIDEVYFIVVDAPQLDQIREKYGLPKREHEFHITIGVKPSHRTII